jgi:Uncharacterised nucleotidyltransferase
METGNTVPPGGDPELLRDTARSLRLDLAAAETIDALAAAGVRAILMKGRVHHRLLYPDGEPRTYSDVDLLVEAGSRRRVDPVLRALGFDHRYTGETAIPDHADDWVREGDRTVLDVHWTLVGASADPHRVWRALSSHTERIVLGGREVEVLGRPAVALQVAMHAAQHGSASPRAMEDLRRAVAAFDEPLWVQASALAAELDAVEMLAAGLALDPAGAGIARAVGLPADRSVETTLLSSSAPPLALGLQKLAGTPTLRGRLRLLAREAFPSRSFLRFWWPPSRRGGLWIAAAYPRRLLWLAIRAPAAFLAWRRAVRHSRSSREVG